MNWSKFNFVQALGAIVALVFYFVGPVISISLLPMGLRGTTAMRIDFVFVIPVILMGLAMLISILPIGRLSSIAGIVAAIGTLIVGLCGGDVLIGKIKALGAVAASAQYPELAALLTGDLSVLNLAGVLMTIGWGALVAVIVMFLASVAGVFVMSLGGNGGSSGTSYSGSGRSSSPMSKPSSSANSRSGGAGNLYRR